MKKYLGGIFLVLILSLNVSANFNQDIADLSNNTDKESYINEVKTNLETANSKVSKKYKSVLPQFVGLISKKFDTEKKLKTFINKLEVIEKKTKSSFKYVLQNLMYNAEIIYLNNYVEVNEDDNSVENNDKKEEEKDDTPAKKLSFINHNFKIEIYEDSPNSGLFKNISSGS
jgi:phosphoglycerate-specific signal transduction histidine kinase